jgi:hypothetical protein
MRFTVFFSFVFNNFILKRTEPIQKQKTSVPSLPKETNQGRPGSAQKELNKAAQVVPAVATASPSVKESTKSEVNNKSSTKSTETEKESKNNELDWKSTLRELELKEEAEIEGKLNSHLFLIVI